MLPMATITATIEAFRRRHSSMLRMHSSFSSVSTVEPAEARSEIGLLQVGGTICRKAPRVHIRQSA